MNIEKAVVKNLCEMLLGCREALAHDGDMTLIPNINNALALVADDPELAAHIKAFKPRKFASDQRLVQSVYVSLMNSASPPGQALGFRGLLHRMRLGDLQLLNQVALRITSRIGSAERKARRGF